jgi:release factor glutamine methyltransferase
VSGKIPDQPITIESALSSARQRLRAFSETPALDARVVLAHLTKKDPTWLLAHPGETLSRPHQAAFNNAIELLRAGTPLPYLIGEWEFYGLKFQVTPDVLIPRPETELLVETALAWIKQHPDAKAAEAGTGSGCIAISLAFMAQNLHITATDISPQALEVARRNATRHHVFDQIAFLENDLLSGLEGPFDLICANLPYIPTDTLRQLAVSRHEPLSALDGGEDGLVYIRRIIDQARDLLAEDGLLLLEIEERQGEAVSRLASEAFPGASIEVKPDLAGKPRLLVVQR